MLTKSPAEKNSLDRLTEAGLTWGEGTYARLAGPIGLDQIGGKAMQMGLVAGRNLQGGAIDFDKLPGLEPLADASDNAITCQEERPPVAVAIGRKPWRLAR